MRRYRYGDSTFGVNRIHYYCFSIVEDAVLKALGVE